MYKASDTFNSCIQITRSWGRIVTINICNTKFPVTRHMNICEKYIKKLSIYWHTEEKVSFYLCASLHSSIQVICMDVLAKQNHHGVGFTWLQYFILGEHKLTKLTMNVHSSL